MIRHLLQNEKPILALVGANGFLASIHKFFLSHQPELTSFLTVLQIVVALITILHFARKYVAAWLAHYKKEQ